MSTLTQKQIRQLQAADYMLAKGNNAVIEKVLEFDDVIDEHVTKINEAITKCDDASSKCEEVISDMKEKVSSLKDGVTPVKGVDYVDGQDYVLTDRDKHDIASQIDVPTIERVIERTEVIKEVPMVTNEIVKEIINSETGEQIVDKINALEIEPELQIDIEHIKGLVEQLKKMEGNSNSNRGFLGVPRRPQWQQKVLTGAINGSNVTFTFEGKEPAQYSERIFLNYIEQNPLTDYTIAGRTIRYTVAPDASLSGLSHIIRSAY